MDDVWWGLTPGIVGKGHSHKIFWGVGFWEEGLWTFFIHF